MIEAAFEGIELSMMFSGPPGVVSGRAKDLSSKSRILEIAITSLMVEPRHEADSGRPAFGRVIHLSVADPARCQLIEIGRLNFRSVTSEVGVTHVIDKYREDVWALVFSNACRCQKQTKQDRAECGDKAKIQI